MQITNIINKDDLGEPYDRLSEFLSIDEIIKLEQEYGGRQIRFKMNFMDIKTEYPELALMFGANKALMIAKILGGIYTYFPKLKRSCADKIKYMILSEFNGYNYLQLAKKFGYTDRHIRNIVEGKGKRVRACEGQISLFD